MYQIRSVAVAMIVCSTMVMAEYQKTLISPDNIGSDDTIMFQANFIIKNPFGSL